MGTVIDPLYIALSCTFEPSRGTLDEPDEYTIQLPTSVMTTVDQPEDMI